MPTARRRTPIDYQLLSLFTEGEPMSPHDALTALVDRGNQRTEAALAILRALHRGDLLGTVVTASTRALRVLPPGAVLVSGLSQLFSLEITTRGIIVRWSCASDRRL